MVGLVDRTTLPVPVVALPVGVPVIVGLEIVGLEIVGVVMVGFVAKTIAPVPVVPLVRSEADAVLLTFSLRYILIVWSVSRTVFVDNTKPSVCLEPCRLLT